MLIIPLGMEGGAVFRLPVISILVGVACLVGFVLSVPMLQESNQLDEQLNPARAYWMEHPYLEVPPEIEKHFVSKAVRKEARRYFDELEHETNRVKQLVETFKYYRALYNREYTPPEPKKRGREQAKLDQMLGDVLPLVRSQPLNRWGLVPSEGLHQAGWITYAFVHAGWLHLAFSLFLFALVAPLLEDAWGRILFFYFLVIGIGAGAAAHFVTEPNLIYPLIGASALIAACLGAFCVRFSEENVQFLVFPAILWFQLVRVVRMPAWLWGTMFFGVLLLTFAFVGDAAGVNYIAHVGGFCVGGAVALFLRVTGIEERFIAPSVEKTHDGWTEHEGLAAAQGAMARGQWGEVQRQLNMVIRDQPNNFEAHGVLARLAVEHKKTEEVTRHVDRMLGTSLADKSDDGVLAVVKEFWPQLEPSMLRPAVAFRAARIVKKEEPAKAEKLFCAVGEGDGPIAARAQLELVDMYLQVKDHHRALPLLQQVLDRGDANPEMLNLAKKRMEYVQEMLGPQLAHEQSDGVEFEDIPMEPLPTMEPMEPLREMDSSPTPAESSSATSSTNPREHRLADAPGVVEYDLEEPAPPPRSVVTCTFAGRDAHGFIAANSKGKTRSVPLAEIAEVKVGILEQWKAKDGIKNNVLVIDLLLRTRRKNGQEVVLRFVSPALGMETLFDPGSDPAAALHTLLTELVSKGAAVSPGSEILAQHYPRFNDVGEFDAVRAG